MAQKASSHHYSPKGNIPFWQKNVKEIVRIVGDCEVFSVKRPGHTVAKPLIVR